MLPTALVYSTHDRSNYIHNDWIVQRALAGNKHILFLPMSEGTPNSEGLGRQEWSWGNFEWFFNFYKGHGLEAYPFFWRNELSRDDVAWCFEQMANVEVLILGGGNPAQGLKRYIALGELYFGDASIFPRILHDRQEKGLLTVGFSAGVDQLCEYMTEAIDYNTDTAKGFGLCRNIMAFSHFEHGPQDDMLYRGAQKFGHCMCFALPNDSGIAVNQGMTPGGNVWQYIQFITDNSWDEPNDAFHIKTRQGMKIQHTYADGRSWAFNGGDAMVRIQSWDNCYSEAFIVMQDSPIFDYWEQAPTGYSNIGEIISSH